MMRVIVSRLFLAIGIILLAITPSYGSGIVKTAGSGSGSVTASNVTNMAYYVGTTTVSGDAGATYATATHIATFTGGVVTGASDSGYLAFSPSTVGDTTWYTGIHGDADAADTDPYELARTSSTAGSSLVLSLNQGSINGGNEWLKLNNYYTASSSTDETVGILFRHGNRDAAELLINKEEDYTSAGNSTSSWINYLSLDGTMTEMTRLTSTGLGIGLTPSYKLDVSGEGQFNGGGQSQTNAGLLINASECSTDINGASCGLQVKAVNDLYLISTDSVNARIGIGTAVPSYKLDISGDVNVQAGGQIRSVGVRVGYNLSVDSAGTVYTLTANSASLDFGTVDPAITVDAAGTYLIMGSAEIRNNAATFVADRVVTIRLRRTNNTSADINTISYDSGVLTTSTGLSAFITIPPTIYTTNNTNDTVTIFGDVSTVPSAGSLDSTRASITAVRVY